jgi:VanZ family protein
LRTVDGSGGRGRAERRARAERIRAWSYVALWIGVILLLAQGSFSAAATGPRLAWLMRLLGFGPEAIDHANFFVRKGAHLAVYAVLGMLALRAVLLSQPIARGVTAALGLSLLVAAGDEAVQSTQVSRTASPRDVALDWTGAWLGAAALAARRGARAAGGPAAPAPARARDSIASGAREEA